MTDASLQIQEIFRDVFDDPALILRDDLRAPDVVGWDSLAHVNLIIAIERKLGIKFATGEISRLKEPGQNVGTFIRLVESKMQKNRV